MQSSGCCVSTHRKGSRNTTDILGSGAHLRGYLPTYMPEVALQYLQATWVAAMRHRGPHDPRVTDATWQELIVWASPRRLMGRNPDARGVGLCWDDPRRFEARERRYDVGVPITPEDVDQVTPP